MLPDTPPVPATYALIHRRKSRPGIIAFGTGNSFVSPIPGAGRFNFTDGGTQARSISALTLLMVSKKTSPSAGTFSSMFQTVGDTVTVGDFNNNVSFQAPGLWRVRYRPPGIFRAMSS